MKKILSITEALEVAHLVYEMNTEKLGVLNLAKHAGLLNIPHIENHFLANSEELFLWEWRAFTHAAILYGLIEYTPAVLVVEYIKRIQNVLKGEGYDEALVLRFIDEPFNAYMEHVTEKNVRACPEVFFKRFNGIGIENSDITQVKVVSGAMAMLLAACVDAFEKYEYALS